VALSDDVSGREVAPGQDFDRRQGIDAAGRVVDAARVALERGDEAGAEDLLNAIRPPDGTIEASMAVLRSKIREIRVARRQFDGHPQAGPTWDGPAATPGPGGWGADKAGAPEDVDEALVAWQFVDPPAAAGGAVPTSAPEPVGTGTTRPGPLLFEPASESRPPSPWMGWAAVLLGVFVAAAAACAYLFLR
jgi:hypothetical protein